MTLEISHYSALIFMIGAVHKQRRLKSAIFESLPRLSLFVGMFESPGLPIVGPRALFVVCSKQKRMPGCTLPSGVDPIKIFSEHDPPQSELLH